MFVHKLSNVKTTGTPGVVPLPPSPHLGNDEEKTPNWEGRRFIEGGKETNVADAECPRMLPMPSAQDKTLCPCHFRACVVETHAWWCVRNVRDISANVDRNVNVQHTTKHARRATCTGNRNADTGHA